MSFQFNEFSEKSDFFKHLCSDQTAKCLLANGNTIRAKFRHGEGTTLIVLFHPAGPPYAENRPYFLPFLPLEVPQISISDPTLEGNDHLSSGWYLGHAEANLPQTLSELMVEFSGFLGTRRRIFVGGSSGGFAALMYSSLDPESLAVAVCPQTDLDFYQNRNTGLFKDTFFPNATESETIKQLTGIDLRERYSAKLPNSLVVTVSPRDHHLDTQIIPLWQRLIYPTTENAILDVRYHGIDGHGGSVPGEYWIGWVKAALAAKSWQTKDLLDAFYVLDNHESDQVNQPPSSPPEKQEKMKNRLADLIKEWELKKATSQ